TDVLPQAGQSFGPQALVGTPISHPALPYGWTTARSCSPRRRRLPPTAAPLLCGRSAPGRKRSPTWVAAQLRLGPRLVLRGEPIWSQKKHRPGRGVLEDVALLAVVAPLATAARCVVAG